MHSMLLFSVQATSATLFGTLLPHHDDMDNVHPQTICHILFRLQGQSSENVHSLSQARQLANAVFTCIGALGTPSRTGPLARKYLPGIPYSYG